VAQKEALEITIDVVIQYLHNIGHSLKLYIDQFSKDTDFLVLFFFFFLNNNNNNNIIDKN